MHLSFLGRPHRVDVVTLVGLNVRPSLCTSVRPQMNSQAQNKLYQIYPTIPSYSTLSSSSLRKDQIIYNRLRIGHTRLTHSYLIEHTDHPKCTNCNQLLSVKHILTECTSCDQARHQYYSFTDIKNILNLTPSQNILNFILKINLYDQL